MPVSSQAGQRMHFSSWDKDRLRTAAPLPPGPMLGFGLAILAVLLITLFSYRSLQTRATTQALVSHTIEVREQLQMVLSALTDAETGQRGYLMTGIATYLAPYSNAKANLPGEINHVLQLVSDSPEQVKRLQAISALSTDKMAELAETIRLYENHRSAEAMAIVRTDRGKLLMDRVRALMADMIGHERNLLAERQADWQNAVNFSSAITWGGAAVLLVLIVAAAISTSRDYRARKRQVWISAGQFGLSESMQGAQRLGVLGDNALAFLAGYLNAQVGAIYLQNDNAGFRRFGAYALSAGHGPEELPAANGLLGQAARQHLPLHVRDVPQDYLSVSSALGTAMPRELLIVPAGIDGVVQAVVELGFFRRIGEVEKELMRSVSDMIAIAVRSSRDRTRLEEVLEETQRQAEQLQAQEEELRVSNEELEEQGQILRNSQMRLEAQQSELEETNAQLEEQAQMLEMQKDDLSRAQTILLEKASELERSNQYKSEFLANMSHELRTPLNSTLILAKLLADNKSGNLHAEQVRFAETILSAGNDLLALINDILDLSRMEAGKIALVPEPVTLARLADQLHATFHQQARQKGVNLHIRIDDNVPGQLETDGQRLGQILRNLLSNALKFTDQGDVTLTILTAPDQQIAFSVADTGIGIAAEHQQFIFEAFRQADGSTHRKYGGTGLGLSISRDLALLLGGDITVQSQPGSGSVFTLTLPRSMTEKHEPHPTLRAGQPAPLRSSILSVPLQPADAPAIAGPLATDDAVPASLPPISVDDDRDRLEAGVRLILVIEDDIAFARILLDLAHEMGFQCIVVQSANDGATAALLYNPSAIVLDMNLPGFSGMGVLDQIKRDPRIRHIPVHVVSVADYAREALERGAVGYALKPVQRLQLVEAFRKLEARFSQRLRHVLVVEDDHRQRDSIALLLGSDDVNIIGVDTAAAALEQLQTVTFDCMVMDLNLPDLNGLALLQRMAEQEHVAFPPVIVYTGRSLSVEEEQELRRFSRSIIIKDVRSPERLLDEVTLFLHQLETTLPEQSQRLLEMVRSREAIFEGRRILVVEDDVRNIFALSSVLEPKGIQVVIARNGLEALATLQRENQRDGQGIDLVLMDIMMPEMDGITAIGEIRKQPAWKKLPIIALTAKAMKDDQDKCLSAGANDYIAKPLDVEKLLSLIRVWMPKLSRSWQQ